MCIFDILLIVCGCLCMHKHMRAQASSVVRRVCMYAGMHACVCMCVYVCVYLCVEMLACGMP